MLEPTVLSVTAVNRYIKRLMEEDSVLTSILVRGEISNFKRHHSGHCYFTLKDSTATIRAVMFKSRAQLLRFAPKDGQQIVAAGQISVFERDGQFQLYVEQLFPDGIGELNLALEQLKERLGAEGLFDETRKQSLPLLPKRIGIVTSPTGAVLRDIYTVAKRRFPGVALVLYPVQVQGPEAPGQIAHAIAVFNNRQDVDVLIVGRGGGSLEELWAFNEEAVVRAIAASHIPVVSAVGHQTDFTLADFAADRRAATPSQAAELVTPDVNEWQRHIINLQTRLVKHFRTELTANRLRLDKCLQSKSLQNPRFLLQDKQQLLDQYMQRLEQSMRQLQTVKRQQLALQLAKLDMLSPLAVLSRGYSLVQNGEGNIIRHAAQVVPGQQLTVLLAKDALRVEVIEREENPYATQEKAN